MEKSFITSGPGFFSLTNFCNILNILYKNICCSGYDMLLLQQLCAGFAVLSAVYSIVYSEFHGDFIKCLCRLDRVLFRLVIYMYEISQIWWHSSDTICQIVMSNCQIVRSQLVEFFIPISCNKKQQKEFRPSNGHLRLDFNFNPAGVKKNIYIPHSFCM